MAGTSTAQTSGQHIHIYNTPCAQRTLLAQRRTRRLLRRRWRAHTVRRRARGACARCGGTRMRYICVSATHICVALSLLWATPLPLYLLMP